ncbi:MAG: hypothetical protein AB9900_10870 [Humidesulfovibrio sp.]
MKLTDLASDAERIEFLLSTIAYVAGCSVCLKSGDCEGHPETCTRTDMQNNPMRGGTLCTDMDFNDCRLIS